MTHKKEKEKEKGKEIETEKEKEIKNIFTPIQDLNPEFWKKTIKAPELETTERRVDHSTSLEIVELFTRGSAVFSVTTQIKKAKSLVPHPSLITLSSKSLTITMPGLRTNEYKFENGFSQQAKLSENSISNCVELKVSPTTKYLVEFQQQKELQLFLGSFSMFKWYNERALECPQVQGNLLVNERIERGALVRRLVSDSRAQFLVKIMNRKNKLESASLCITEEFLSMNTPGENELKFFYDSSLIMIKERTTYPIPSTTTTKKKKKNKNKEKVKKMVMEVEVEVEVEVETNKDMEEDKEEKKDNKKNKKDHKKNKKDNKKKKKYNKKNKKDNKKNKKDNKKNKKKENEKDDQEKDLVKDEDANKEKKKQNFKKAYKPQNNNQLFIELVINSLKGGYSLFIECSNNRQHLLIVEVLRRFISSKAKKNAIISQQLFDKKKKAKCNENETNFFKYQNSTQFCIWSRIPIEKYEFPRMALCQTNENENENEIENTINFENYLKRLEKNFHIFISNFDINGNGCVIQNITNSSIYQTHLCDSPLVSFKKQHIQQSRFIKCKLKDYLRIGHCYFEVDLFVNGSIVKSLIKLNRDHFEIAVSEKLDPNNKNQNDSIKNQLNYTTFLKKKYKFTQHIVLHPIQPVFFIELNNNQKLIFKTKNYFDRDLILNSFIEFQKSFFKIGFNRWVPITTPNKKSLRRITEILEMEKNLFTTEGFNEILKSKFEYIIQNKKGNDSNGGKQIENGIHNTKDSKIINDLFDFNFGFGFGYNSTSYPISLFNSLHEYNGICNIQLNKDHFILQLPKSITKSITTESSNINNSNSNSNSNSNNKINNLIICRKYNIFSKLVINKSSLVGKFIFDENHCIIIGFSTPEEKKGFVLDFNRKKNTNLSNQLIVANQFDCKIKSPLGLKSASIYIHTDHFKIKTNIDSFILPYGFENYLKSHKTNQKKLILNLDYNEYIDLRFENIETSSKFKRSFNSARKYFLDERVSNDKKIFITTVIENAKLIKNCKLTFGTGKLTVTSQINSDNDSEDDIIGSNKDDDAYDNSDNDDEIYLNKSDDKNKKDVKDKSLKKKKKKKDEDEDEDEKKVEEEEEQEEDKDKVTLFEFGKLDSSDLSEDEKEINIVKDMKEIKKNKKKSTYYLQDNRLYYDLIDPNVVKLQFADGNWLRISFRNEKILQEFNESRLTFNSEKNLTISNLNKSKIRKVDTSFNTLAKGIIFIDHEFVTVQMNKNVELDGNRNETKNQANAGSSISMGNEIIKEKIKNIKILKNFDHPNIIKITYLENKHFYFLEFEDEDKNIKFVKLFQIFKKNLILHKKQAPRIKVDDFDKFSIKLCDNESEVIDGNSYILLTSNFLIIDTLNQKHRYPFTKEMGIFINKSQESIAKLSFQNQEYIFSFINRYERAQFIKELNTLNPHLRNNSHHGKKQHKKINKKTKSKENKKEKSKENKKNKSKENKKTKRQENKKTKSKENKKTKSKENNKTKSKNGKKTKIKANEKTKIKVNKKTKQTANNKTKQKLQSNYQVLSFKSNKSKKQLRGSLSLTRNSINLIKGNDLNQFEISQEMKVLIAKNNPTITCLVLPDGKREPILFDTKDSAKDFSRKFRTIKRRMAAQNSSLGNALSNQKD
ncbi:resistance to inhibitors of cholinesterase protein 3 ric3 [Anaeramoeba flamelloides]|uniref:Resistance to inhibitors of cholinesterase protein 3 ric3 n=1 Tax=Anaeramoeba flamelloides TaxID=1746091 RepID=A0AAV7ZWR0_9EUKA|nr:resistance to inhibitors of cholinesterase protein 3 ric3 [Anaeramoeba flamelloides]